MTTPVLFHFLTPEGEPVANAEFEIQLATSNFDLVIDGVLMPRTLFATTDVEGRATVNLWAQSTSYLVTMLDPESEVGLRYKFYVPEVAEGESVRLQDIVVPQTTTDVPYVDLVYQQIQTARDNTLAYRDAAMDAAASTATDVATITEAVGLTSGDRVQTGLDRVATAADRVQTAADRVQTGLDAANAASYSATISSKAAFTTVALGLAATTNGQTFAVKQTFGEGVDVYLNNAGAAVWQGAGSTGELAYVEVAERYYPSAVTPLCSMFSHHTLVQNGRGSNNAVRPRSKVLGRNLYAYVHGVRNASTGPVPVQGFADGPNKTGTAARVQFTTTAQLMNIWISSLRPVAGTYTVCFALKSNSGSDVAIRTGNSAQGYTARTVLAAGWTTFLHEITTDGTNWASFVVTGDGTSIPDLLWDNTRIYPCPAAEVPLYQNDFYDDLFMPAVAFPKTRHVGRLLDNTQTTADGAGVFVVPGYPTPKAFTEATLLGIGALDTAQSNEQLITTDASTLYGTTNATLAITATSPDGAPDFSGITSFFAYNMVGQGLVPLSLCATPTERRAYLDNIELGSATVAFTGFSARHLRYLSNASNDATAHQSTFRWNGRGGGAAVYDKGLNAGQIALESDRAMNILRGAGLAGSIATIPYFLLGMGDSQTASLTGSRGPSWAVNQANPGLFTPNLPMRNLAVGGATRDNLVDLQLPTALMVIDQVLLRAWRRAITAIFVATNDQAAIVTDWNNGVNSFNDPNGWWQQTKLRLFAPILAKGPRSKLVLLTPLPDGGAPPANWEPARVALGARMIADYLTSTQVFVADIGSATGIGTLADTSTTNYDTDHRHLLTAGHAIATPVVTIKVQAAINAAA